jgi:hypothetical protein
MNIEKKILYYQTEKWCIPFIELLNTINFFCKIVIPIYPSINPLKYIEYFIDKIEFDKIDNNPNKTETQDNCYFIYYGLEQFFKIDIDQAIHDYQGNISKLTDEQATKIQLRLLESIGTLKLQTRNNKDETSFTERYKKLSNTIKGREYLTPIDYQVIIMHFNETLSNDLLSSFKIINKTISELNPLRNKLKELPIQKKKSTIDKQKGKKKHKILKFPEYLKVDESCQENFANLILKEYKNYSGYKIALLLMALMDKRLIDITKYSPIINAMYEFGFNEITDINNCYAITKDIQRDHSKRLNTTHNFEIARIKNTLDNIKSDNNII